MESFLKTGSVAANWWHGYRTSAEFLKPFEELEAKLQAVPKPSKEDANLLEREAAQSMKLLREKKNNMSRLRAQPMNVMLY